MRQPIEGDATVLEGDATALAGNAAVIEGGVAVVEGNATVPYLRLPNSLWCLQFPVWQYIIRAQKAKGNVSPPHAKPPPKCSEALQ